MTQPQSGATRSGRTQDQMPPYSQQRRRAERKPVVIHAKCRTGTGGFGQVTIVDLTDEGCQIFAKGLPLRAGQAVRISPENFQPLPGTVCWTQGGYAGIAFDAALYQPVVEHLQRRFRPLRSE